MDGTTRVRRCPEPGNGGSPTRVSSTMVDSVETGGTHFPVSAGVVGSEGETTRG